jgi:hypothetical protein
MNNGDLIDSIAYTIVSIIFLFNCLISFSHIDLEFIISSATALVTALLAPYKLANYNLTKNKFLINLIASIAFGILLSGAIGLNIYLAKFAYGL